MALSKKHTISGKQRGASLRVPRRGTHVRAWRVAVLAHRTPIFSGRTRNGGRRAWRWRKASAQAGGIDGGGNAWWRRMETGCGHE